MYVREYRIAFRRCTASKLIANRRPSALLQLSSDRRRRQRITFDGSGIILHYLFESHPESQRKECPHFPVTYRIFHPLTRLERYRIKFWIIQECDEREIELVR